MSTIVFYLKSKKKLSQIYVRVRDGREIDLSTKTDLLINPEHWNFKTHSVKKICNFNERYNFIDKLNSLEDTISNQIAN